MNPSDTLMYWEWGNYSDRINLRHGSCHCSEFRIGLDTDDNGLIDSFEIAAWSVPIQEWAKSEPTLTIGVAQ